MANSAVRSRIVGLCGAMALLVGAAGGLGSASAAIVIQQTTIYISTLPKGCVKKTYTSNNGKVTVWSAEPFTYQPYKVATCAFTSDSGPAFRLAPRTSGAYHRAIGRLVGSSR